MVGVTLSFDYPWSLEDVIDENEIRDCLMELSPSELLNRAEQLGKPINVDIEVY